MAYLMLVTLPLCGCQTMRKELPAAPITPPMPTIPIQNEANVRLPETVKAYAVNRYQDPIDPRIMHERHIIYRQEKAPRWRLSAAADRQILIGPTMTDASLDHNPALLEKELALELQHQRELSNEQRELAQQLLQRSAELSEIASILQEKVTALEERLAKPTK